jgi:hypothetical protein
VDAVTNMQRSAAAAVMGAGAAAEGACARLVLGALASRQKGLRADASVAAFCAICEHNIEH